jgi:hypothetical protein
VSLLAAVPAGLLSLPALSLAAGLDLYLTLLVLGLAPHTGLWETAPAGALGGMGSPGVLLVAGGFYLMEVAAERWPTSALVWNGFHAVIRPLSGALLALLLLESEPAHIKVVGAGLAAALASLAHGVRTGSRFILWLRGATSPNRWLLSAMEDVVVVAIIVLALDLPGPSAGIAGFIALVWVARGRSDVRAFVFAGRLGLGRVWRSLGRAGWTVQGDFPGWVQERLSHEGKAVEGGFRGSPAGAFRLPGAPRFTTGWLVVRRGVPFFVHRGSPDGRPVELSTLSVTGITEERLFRRIDLRGGEHSTAFICLSVDGPAVEALTVELPSA